MIGAAKLPEIVAHRGAQTLANRSEIAPENTAAAFEAAAKRQVAIELDVIATRDGRLVVHHDDETGRIFSLPKGERWVRDVDFADISKAALSPSGVEAAVNRMLGQPSAGESFVLNPEFETEKIPLLETVLDRFPDTHIYIELKTDTADPKVNNDLERRVVELIQKKKAHHRVTVISFSPFSVRKVKQLDARIRTGLDFVIPAWARRPGLENIAFRLYTVFGKFLGVDSLHPPYESVTQGRVKLAHRRGFKLSPWVYHQNREEEKVYFPKLLAMGVDGIITNAIDALSEALQDFKKSKS